MAEHLYALPWRCPFPPLHHLIGVPVPRGLDRAGIKRNTATMKRARRLRASILPALLATLAVGAVLWAHRAASESAQPAGDPKPALLAASDPAVVELLQSAAQGEVEAQDRLGLRLCTGAGVVRDISEAVTWFRKAAEQGYAPAQWRLGYCYSSGFLGVTKDLVASATWFRKAAEQGVLPAQCELGYCYGWGLGVEKDPVAAVVWFRKAATQGLPEAQYRLGLCYEDGTGVEKDPIEGVKWYRKAAAQANAPAQYRLGLSYDNGYGVEKNVGEAVKWYRLAAEQVYAPAQLALGACFADGKGVAKDPDASMQWFGQAVEQGEGPAHWRRCYRMHGEGDEKDIAEASRASERLRNWDSRQLTTAWGDTTKMAGAWREIPSKVSSATARRRNGDMHRRSTSLG